ncbi:MAG: histidine kinase [Bacteroidales bacterium]|nr:histidine kinase [Bacteroidales bacterium]
MIYNDSIYIASKDGLTVISDSYFRKKVSVPPRPYTKSVLINNINIQEIPQEIQVTGKNTISIHFKCIDYAVNSYIYSYSLEGLSNVDSVSKGNDLDVVYQNLPKGHYVFKLRVRKANSDWSETLELPIIIKPTFYEYPAFWVLIFLILIFIGIQTFMQLKQMRLNRIENNHQLVMLEQKALLSMMNPHFIFNSLGSIQNFMLRNRSGEALIYLSQFSRLIRQNFNAVNVAVINLEDEIDRLKNYLELEQIRLENKFEYFIEIDGGFSEDVFFIPSMIIQPFAENAVWHGIASINYKGIIRIKFIYVTDDIIKVIIEDNGVGIQDNKNSKKKSLSHLHQGMKMTKRRLMLLGEKIKSKSVLEITPLSPNNKFPGTRIVIHLPFIMKTLKM